MGLTKGRQVHLFRQMSEHSCFVTLSATEIGCLSEHDGLWALSPRLIVCNCVREGVLVNVQHTVSDHAGFRYSILGVSYSLTPLNAATVTNSIFILSPTLPLPSFQVTLPLSNTYSTLSLYLSTSVLYIYFFSPPPPFFFNLDLDLSVEQECHLVSMQKIAHILLQNIIWIKTQKHRR